MTIETGLLAGVALDALSGDPRRGHPVAAFGRAAAALEHRMYADSKTRGAVFAGVCVLGAVGLGAAGTAVVSRFRASAPVARSRFRGDASAPGLRCYLRLRGNTLVTAVATWAVLGGTSLAREGRAMERALEAGDLGAARSRLPHLCGRDPEGLGVKELTRATVESVAENTSDAAVAPLVWGAAFGLPGLLGYRAVNTLDAMVGHRSPRYASFGWASARADDVANWLPARLTGLLTVVLAPIAGGSPREAYRILRRDGGRHPSPNAGRCEAAFAGALGVRLGGVNVYGTRAEHRPELGDGRPPEPADIRRAVRLSRAVALTSAVLAAGTRAALTRAALGGRPVIGRRVIGRRG
jgi:adenosylcobinamide-phosphate synthase